MVGAIIAIVIILGGGATIAASDNARPGDTLFGLDLAVEKAKINLASSEEKKSELRAKFEDERKAELTAMAEMKGSANVRDTDLSESNVTEIEVDVFTNETTVKVEADDRHYGFVTSKKVRAEIVAEIAAKYELSESEVDAMMTFEVEDRASRVEDKGFLNSSNSIKADVKIGDDKDWDDNSGKGSGAKVDVNVGGGLNFGDNDSDDEDGDNSGHGGGKY